MAHIHRKVLFNFLIPSTITFFRLSIPFAAKLFTSYRFPIKSGTFIRWQRRTTFLIFSKETATISTIAFSLLRNATTSIDTWLQRGTRSQ